MQFGISDIVQIDYLLETTKFMDVMFFYYLIRCPPSYRQAQYTTLHH